MYCKLKFYVNYKVNKIVIYIEEEYIRYIEEKNNSYNENTDTKIQTQNTTHAYFLEKHKRIKIKNRFKLCNICVGPNSLILFLISEKICMSLF